MLNLKSAYKKVVLSLFLLLSAMAQASDFSGDINLTLGNRWLLLDEWSDLNLDSQPTIGIQTNLGFASWPISLVLGYNQSWADSSLLGADLEIKQSEFYAGLAYHFYKEEMLQPFISGGLSKNNNKLTVSDTDNSVSSSDDLLGLWLSGGLNYHLTDSINLGAEVKYQTYTDAELFSGHYGMENVMLNFLIGYHW